MWLGVVSERETGRREVTDIIRARLCRASKAFKRGWMDSKGDGNIIRVLGLLFKVIIQATE